MTELSRIWSDPSALTNPAVGVIGPDDPTAVSGGVDLPIGSEYRRRTTGAVYEKVGPNPIDWSLLAAASGVYLPLTGGNLNPGANLGVPGVLVVGTDPGGAQILRVGGQVNLAGDVTFGQRLILTGTVSGLGGATRYIGVGASASILYHNVPTGGQHIFAVNEVSSAAISSTIFSGILLIQQSGQGTHFLGSNAANSNPTVLAIRGGSVAGGVAGIDLIGGGSQIKWSQGSTVDWMIYQNQADPNIYWRDVVNSRMQVTLAPGTTDSTALTTFGSKVTVNGLLTAILNLAVGGTVAITGTSLTLDGATATISTSTITTYGLNFLTGGAALRIRVGGLLVSSAYSNDNLVPTNGIYSLGAITSAAGITGTTGTFTSTLVVTGAFSTTGGVLTGANGTNNDLGFRPGGSSGVLSFMSSGGIQRASMTDAGVWTFSTAGNWTLTGWARAVALTDGGAIEFGSNRSAGAISFGVGTTGGQLYLFSTTQRDGSAAATTLLQLSGTLATWSIAMIVASLTATAQVQAGSFLQAGTYVKSGSYFEDGSNNRMSAIILSTGTPSGTPQHGTIWFQI